jgi:trehalose 6-phosphate phosphatase
MNPVAIALSTPPAALLAGASMFLDFDGTLVEIAERPDAVAVDARLRALIGCLTERLDGRVAIISGRAAADIRTLFGDVPIAIAGSHGIELCWPDGRIETPDRPAALRERHPGILIEDKPFGAALHYRQAPEAEEEARALAERLARDHGLALQPGKMVVEIQLHGHDKGAALRAFMAEPLMEGTRPVFIGDDITDESAFAAARSLNGFGILVGPPRATEALYGLAGVAQSLDWLDAACRSLK